MISFQLKQGGAGAATSTRPESDDEWEHDERARRTDQSDKAAFEARLKAKDDARTKKKAVRHSFAHGLSFLYITQHAFALSSDASACNSRKSSQKSANTSANLFLVQGGEGGQREIE